MKHKEGYILKSVEGGKKGKNEVRFYEGLKNDESLINLRALVPSYFGTVTVKINSKGMLIYNLPFSNHSNALMDFFKYVNIFLFFFCIILM